MAQFGWLLLGGLIGLGIFLSMSAFSKILGAIVGVVVGASISLPLAFYKKAGYPILKYWKFKNDFNRKQKKLPNKRILEREGGEK